VEAIRVVHQGRKYVAHTVARKLTERINSSVLTSFINQPPRDHPYPKRIGSSPGFCRIGFPTDGCQLTAVLNWMEYSNSSE